MSQRTPAILTVSPDPRLEEEVRSALSGIPDLSPILHSASDHRQGAEAARSRHPDFVLVEMTRDLRSLKSFAEEVVKGSPETNLAAVFSADLFGHDVSESALLIQAMRIGLQDFLRRPVSRIDLEQLLERLYRRASPLPVRAGKIISFVSNKGGVGKSTLSANLACGLAQRHPEQVLLIDASLQMGVAASLLDLKPSTTLTDTAREQDRLDETLFRQLATPHSSGLHLLAAPAGPVEAAEIDDQVMARVLNLARRAYDFVLVDSFPLLDRVMMAVLDLSDRIYVVLEGLVPTVLGVAQLLKLLESLGVPVDRLRLILNRFTGSSDNLKREDIAGRLGRSIDFVVPYHKKIAIATNLGQPYILTSSRLWGLGRTLFQMVADIESTPRAVRASADRGSPSVNGTGPTREKDNEPALRG